MDQQPQGEGDDNITANSFTEILCVVFTNIGEILHERNFHPFDFVQRAWEESVSVLFIENEKSVSVTQHSYLNQHVKTRCLTSSPFTYCKVRLLYTVR